MEQAGTNITPHYNMAEKVAHVLTQQGKSFDMKSIELMAINGGDVAKWTSGAHAVARLPGWNKAVQVLLWVDNGNA